MKNNEDSTITFFKVSEKVYFVVNFMLNSFRKIAKKILELAENLL